MWTWTCNTAGLHSALLRVTVCGRPDSCALHENLGLPDNDSKRLKK